MVVDCNIKTIEDYSLYKSQVEESNYGPHNRDMNEAKPVYGIVKPSGILSSIRFETLFQYASRLSIKKGDPFCGKMDEIIEMIRALKTDAEFMDSRCYPTGFAMEGNVMVVGEAPGTYGRAIERDYLKPTFVFTRTSWILRNALQGSFKVAPYITNLCKYARPLNKVSNSDFQDCLHIFRKEVEHIKPMRIIALGKNPYSFLKKHLYNGSFVLNYVPHPAYIWRSNIRWENYSEIFRNVLAS